VKDLAVLVQSPLHAYISFLALGGILFSMCGGLRTAKIKDILTIASPILEGFGLVILQMKIRHHASVRGISLMTMIMYVLVYSLRGVAAFPLPGTLSWYFADSWAVFALLVASLVLVLDILRTMCITYRSTYQSEFDVLKIQNIVVGCVVLAAVLHPSFMQGALFSYLWTTCLYLDVSALLPQVVMMAHGGGLVEAPISHFVAATALSRTVDLWWWYCGFDIGPQGYILGFNFSGWLIMIVHIFGLLVVADFMYYYVKARCSGQALTKDLELPEHAVV